MTRPPAPPPLDLVQAFLNSVDLEDGIEEFATVASLEAWVAQRLPEAADSLTETDRRRATQVRETLRDVVEGDPTGEATRALQRTLNRIPFILQINGDDRPALVTNRTGIDSVLARIMANVYEAMIDGSWDRFKICRNDVCRWAFYDTSRNHSGVWCSMATCGSQAKARAYRSRSRKKAR